MSQRVGLPKAPALICPFMYRISLSKASRQASKRLGIGLAGRAARCGRVLTNMFVQLLIEPECRCRGIE